MVIPATYKTIRIKGGGKVALRNTSPIPDEELVKLVRFALADLNIGKCAVHVKTFHRGSHYGFAYYSVPIVNGSTSVPSWCQHLITVRVAKGESRTCTLDTIAHEGRHIDEYRAGRRRRNKKTRNSEASARAWAAKRVRDWEEQAA